jgi:hypothetical protein
MAKPGGVPMVALATRLPVQVLRREMLAPEGVMRALVLPETKQAPAPDQPGPFVTLAGGSHRPREERGPGTCNRPRSRGHNPGGGDDWERSVPRA